MFQPRLVQLDPKGVPLADRSDDDLMVLAKTGARDAFGALARRHMDRLVRFCAKQTGDVRAAEEVAQDTWAYLWTTRERYVPQGKFVVLLFTAARNRCLNHLRGAKRERLWLAPEDAEAPAPLETAAPSHLDALLVRERQRGVLAALGKMPPAHREALLLRFGEELSYEEVAAIQGAGPSTIRSRVRVHHGLKGLRALLGGGSGSGDEP
jgi:RNA polymerase sigma-70 factor (ECF subfamily)